MNDEIYHLTRSSRGNPDEVNRYHEMFWEFCHVIRIWRGNVLTGKLRIYPTALKVAKAAYTPPQQTPGHSQRS